MINDSIETWLLKRQGITMKENVPFIKGEEFLEPLETIPTVAMIKTCNPIDAVVERKLDSKVDIHQVILSQQGRTGVSESSLEGAAFYDPSPPRGDQYLKR